MPFSVDLHEYLVEMPTPKARFHLLNPTFSDPGSKHRAEPILPEPDSFKANIDGGAGRPSEPVSNKRAAREKIRRTTGNFPGSGLITNR